MRHNENYDGKSLPQHDEKKSLPEAVSCSSVLRDIILLYSSTF